MSAIDELASRVPRAALTLDGDVLEGRRFDSARFCKAGRPLALVRPTSAEEVGNVMRWASEHRVPVVPQGALTGRSGAANAVDGGVLLSLQRMSSILEIDPASQLAVVEPGVLNSELSRAARAAGMYYPPDPSSMDSSTIGGNLATNAGGLCCVKYGVTADFVRGLEVVLADGRTIATGQRTVKGVAGLNLAQLIVGSEGTLGVITKAVLGLRPAPEMALTAAAVFDNVRAALDAANSIMAQSLQPSLMEFLDGPTIRAVQRYRDLGLPDNGEAMLLVQSDRAGRAADDIAAMEAICAGFGAVDVARADDELESEMLLSARRVVGVAVDQMGATLVEDVAVPRAALTSMLSDVAAIADRHAVVVATSGHVGDGNMHPTIVFDADDEEQVRRAHLAFDDIMEAALRLGGTITGEHGVGLTKRSWLRRELGDANYDLQRRIKWCFDPLNIMNPGKVF